MRSLSKTVAWTCLLLAARTVAAASLTVNDPFKNETARSHFHQCFPEVSLDDLDRLKNIATYGYLEFPPPTSCITPGCNPQLKEFTSTRVLRTKAPQLNLDTLQRSVYALEGGDCSYNRIRYFSAAVGQNQMRIDYVPFHQERSCNYGFVFDKGNAKANVNSTITLQEDFSTTVNTVVTNIETNSNFSFGNAFSDSLLGSIIGGPVATFLGAIGLPKLATLLGVGAPLDIVKSDVNFAQVGVNFYAYSKVQKKLDKLGHTTSVKPYMTRRELSGFRLEGRDVSVEIIQTAQVLDVIRQDFTDTRRLEIEFLSSLNEVNGKNYVVQEGDNLWGIVRREYLDARLYILIGRLNNLPDHNLRLRPGMVLKLPRWHEICKQLGGNPDAVLKGESLWSKAQKGQIPKDLSMVKTYSGKKSLIYPLELLFTPPN